MVVTETLLQLWYYTGCRMLAGAKCAKLVKRWKIGVFMQESITPTTPTLTNALIYRLIMHLNVINATPKQAPLTPQALTENTALLGEWQQILTGKLAKSAAQSARSTNPTSQPGRRPTVYVVVVDKGPAFMLPGAAALATYLGRRNATSLRVQLSRADNYLEILRPMPGNRVALVEVTKATENETENYWATQGEKPQLPAPLPKLRIKRSAPAVEEPKKKLAKHMSAEEKEHEKMFGKDS